ncbi:roadblock/LC7 domain-containing protein [Streptomyces sp. NPDC090106]|uniref:roadblock/LC7 domain-containing protein n=1 Tax=Streptomyces sp. NPDC090106 TaxID=3365946 RepID=UPI0038007F89
MTDDHGGQTMTTAASSSTSVPAQEQMAGLLVDFVEQVPGVTHALLISRDALRLVDSGFSKTWADTWAATLGTLASLCENIPGPRGDKGPLQQVVIEREDALIFATIGGTSAAFPHQPGNTAGVVDTVLAVIAEPTANAGTVGYEMGQLVDRFAPYMVAAIRTA